MLTEKYLEFYNKISDCIPSKRIFIDELRTLAYGTDASFYRLIPQIVIKTESESEIKSILTLSQNLKLPVTFRAGGTSLSGQGVSDSILVHLGGGWTKFNINEDASKISLQPGIVGALANFYLAPYGKKIGPDPASINAAMIGGIASNNASGMCCGTAQNSYKTLSSMKIIFGDGTMLDTADDNSREEFLSSKKEFVNGILNLRKRISGNTELTERIHHKYKTKNTTGYSINALVDFEEPIDIIQHLMIGSEGTLGFIAEITYNTVPEYKDKASALMLFNNIETACKAVEKLKEVKADAVELMDRASLSSVEDKEGMPSYLKSLDENVAALLVETRAVNRDDLKKKMEVITASVADLPKVFDVTFTDVPAEYEMLWNIRKGLFPSVGSMRKTGTTCIIEDVTFPIPKLAQATLDLQSLFKKYEYDDAIIYGHALDGNLHFVINQNFNISSEVIRYKNFIEELTGLVVKKYDGALKAEHGTGRNMAPFVELEWGAEAYSIMKEIKNIFDPDNLINPGVILNADSEAHIKSLKPLPEANTIIDKCIECGFCEVKCPSKNLTLTPRQRITTYRELARLKATNENNERLNKIKDDYNYAGNETCATDGLCAMACPVSIDTGKLIKDLRFNTTTEKEKNIAAKISGNFGAVTGLMKTGLNIVDSFHQVLGDNFMQTSSDILRKISNNKIPQWNKYMPKGADPVHYEDSYSNNRLSGNELKTVYFPSCITRTMGVSADYDEKASLTTVTQRLLKKAGCEILFPANLSKLCCGMAFDSKGFKEQGLEKAKELEAELLAVSENGKYPVLVDMSPCLYRMKVTLDKRIKLYEPIEFILKYLAERLDFHKVDETITIHTTCSSTKMGLESDFKKLAEMCSSKVIVPTEVSCCGWAGDRGFTFPELNKSALSKLKQQIPEDCKHGYSTSRTCEIGLSVHSEISYKSIIYLVDRCTTPKK
jgi:D-lactate dehydrogenase